MGWRRACCALAIACLVCQAADAACPALSVNFFPAGTANVPAGWTKAAQNAAGNEDMSSLNTITLTAKPTPKLFIQPVHPLFSKRTCVPQDCFPSKAAGRRRLAAQINNASAVLRSAVRLLVDNSQSDRSEAIASLGFTGDSSSRQLLATCLTTVAVPAAYDIQYNIDGGVNKKATLPKDSPPYVSLTTLDTLALGKHTLNIMVTMLRGTGEVNSVATLQPPADQQFTAKVVFTLVDKLPASSGTAAADAATADEPAVPGDAADAPAPAAAASSPAKPSKNATEVLADNPQPDPAIDATVTQQAVKYYCMRQYNVAGKIMKQVEVPVGDDGVMACGVECNSEGTACGGFGLTGKKCFLIKQFDTRTSKADAAMDALCMKSPNDWVDFGTRNAALVGSGFYCLRGYDLKGDPAGSGDADTPSQPTTTEITGMTPSTCATTCRSTFGCQYMLMKKPAIEGGTATCYLKMHALGGLYGTTGPSPDVDSTCFNGQDAWLTFGGQLDYALPSPEINTGVETPAVAAIAPIGVNGTGKTYQCVKQYNVQGSSLKKTNVSMGDEGLTQCASKCDEQKPSCVAFSMSETGQCNLLKSISLNSSASDARTYGLCFGNTQDWNNFGQPDADGMYCLKKYDFAGDGVRTVDYITITAGSAAVQFCKQQCAAEPQCQYVVTSKGKCYMKNNILSGNFGTTEADDGVDATCVKGQQNWGQAALQVAANPVGMVNSLAANTTARRREALLNGAGDRGQPMWGVILLLCSLLLGLSCT